MLKSSQTSITAYGGSGAVEIDGKVAKFIEKELGVKVKFDSLSHGVIHAKVKAEAPRFSVDIVLERRFPVNAKRAKEEGMGCSL